MVEDDVLACARSSVEGGFQDAVRLIGAVYAFDDQNNRAPGDPVTIWEGKGTLKRMSAGMENQVADRLQGVEGYLLKIPYGIPPLERVQGGEKVEGIVAEVDGARFEIVASFYGEARATHSKLYLKRLT